MFVVVVSTGLIELMMGKLIPIPFHPEGSNFGLYVFPYFCVVFGSFFVEFTRLTEDGSVIPIGKTANSS